ncbi:DUF6998 domain-containing protein [Piscinibacter sp.]|uniref:DUF6998 domain-containing protein n=1 Tax=Piscinibacter sp. TaxID=1903157 RepID=UPI00391FABAC
MAASSGLGVNSFMKAVVTEEYNGPGASVWAMVSHKPRLKNGQYQVALSTLRRLMQSVDKEHRLERVAEA